MEDSNTVHLAFHVADEYQSKHHSLPRPWHPEDANEFVRMAHELNDAQYKFEGVSDFVLRLFSSTLTGQLAPVNAVIGGTAAQEVMKACSGKFSPIFQYFYFDCRECLPEKPLFDTIDPAEFLVRDEDPSEFKRYKAQIAVFGREFQKKLGKSRYFIVGAGALGCEYIKVYIYINILHFSCCYDHTFTHSPKNSWILGFTKDPFPKNKTHFFVVLLK